MTHSWRGMEHANTNPLGVEWIGLTMGLGFVLQLRLLVHQLSGGAARHGGRLRRVCPPRAADRRDSQDVLPVPGDPARADRGLGRRTCRARATRHIPSKRPTSDRPDARRACAALPLDSTTPTASSRSRPIPITGASGRCQRATRLRLQPHHSGHAAALLPDRHARPGTDGAAGQLHVRHGRQRHRLQHRVDLRHLPGLHQQKGPTRITCGWAEWPPSAACCSRSARPTRPPASTTSWMRCSWSSRWSMRRCSPPSCWACSGSAPPATARSPA